MAGADEVLALAADFGKASGAVARTLNVVYRGAGESFAEAWRANARATSGRRGAHYPPSVTSETKFGIGGITTDTGPEIGRKGGAAGRGYELGSINQPPHLDGLNAMPAAEALLEQGADVALGRIMP